MESFIFPGGITPGGRGFGDFLPEEDAADPAVQKTWQEQQAPGHCREQRQEQKGEPG